MSDQTKAAPVAMDQQALKQKIGDILAGIRIPDLPYPVGQVDASKVTDWRPLLLSCWNEQRDESVTRVIKSVSLTWTVRQVNAAYIADRIMDVFLQTSGLHVVLATKVARLRFFLAWRLGDDSASAFEDSIRSWLDSLADWRGWSDSGGRSARALVDQLDNMVIAVSSSFESGDLGPFESFCAQWAADGKGRNERVDKLRQRLLETETGAARQRRAEQTARAAVGRALSGRQLPQPISSFVLEHWLPLMRQVVWACGPEGEDWKHTNKLLEWLVWVGDPTLSNSNMDRLYQVGEQIGDRIADVWQRVIGQAMPDGTMAGVEAVIVARLRGETPDLVPALNAQRGFEYDTGWLSFQPPAERELTSVLHQWFVEGEGEAEQRRYFFALLADTCEVLWTNGFGVKLGLMPWPEFVAARNEGVLRPIPPLNRFDEVLSETVTSLAGVYENQRKQRARAAKEAKARAEELRRKVEAAEEEKRREIAAKRAELERQKAEEEQRRQAEEEAERARMAQEKLEVAIQAVEGLKLGGWIALEPTLADEASVRLKLAVRINASRKLVFVDRLGLNRTEFTEDALVADIVAGKIRVLTSTAEFDDTLSRVVGRIRVGRN